MVHNSDYFLFLRFLICVCDDRSEIRLTGTTPISQNPVSLPGLLSMVIKEIFSAVYEIEVQYILQDLLSTESKV